MAIDLETERARVRRILATQSKDVPDTEAGGDLAWNAMISYTELCRAKKPRAAARFAQLSFAMSEKKYNPRWSPEKKQLFAAEWYAGWATEEIAASFGIVSPYWLGQIARRLKLMPRARRDENSLTTTRRAQERQSYRDETLLWQARRAEQSRREREEAQLLRVARKNTERAEIRLARAARKAQRLEAAEAERRARQEARAARKAQRLEARYQSARELWLSGNSLKEIASMVSGLYGNRKAAARLLAAAGVEVKPKVRVWTADEKTSLRALVSQGTSLTELTKALKRSASEIERQAEKMGLTELSDLRFVSGMSRSRSVQHSHGPKRSQ